MEHAPRISRRSALKSAVTVGTTSVVGLGAITYTTQPALAAQLDSWTTEDASITTADGTVDAVNMDPQLTIDYENLSSDSDVEVVISLAVDSTGPLNLGEPGDILEIGTPADWSYIDTSDGSGQGPLTLPGTSGSETLDLAELNALNVITSGGGNETLVYESNQGETNETYFALYLSVGPPSESGLSVATDVANSTVAITNATPTMSVSGSTTVTLSSTEEVQT